MSRKILLVDDEPHILLVVQKRLEHLGYEVITANNGKEALVAAREGKPDLILLDILMPEMDGVACLQNLQIDKDLQHIPVVMLTAKVQDSDKESAINFGASAYLIKPLNPNDLQGVLGTLIK